MKNFYKKIYKKKKKKKFIKFKKYIIKKYKFFRNIIFLFKNKYFKNLKAKI